MASRDIDPARYGLTPEDLQRSAWWIAPNGRTSAGHGAVAHALVASRGGWPAVGRALMTPPLSWLARLGYRAVARWRHRIPLPRRVETPCGNK